MGHCEMLLAVAGLSEELVADRTRRLASGDWSSFTPAERVAFAFARKQAKAPASVTADDLAELSRHFGPDRAFDVLWWSCRCHYMTRVADGFQLPLERDNVFMGRTPMKGATRWHEPVAGSGSPLARDAPVSRRFPARAACRCWSRSGRPGRRAAGAC
jgi:hypothetical protein